MSANSSIRILRRLCAFFGWTVLPSSVILAQSSWKKFASPVGFSVMYPASWPQVDTSGGFLDILSSREFAEGVRIAPNEAEIAVRAPNGGRGVGLSELIDRFSKEATVLSRRYVEVRASSPTACDTLAEVVFRDTLGPGAYEIDTVFFCDLQTRWYSLILRNHEGDAHQSEYQGVALQMARSLRAAS